MPSAAKKKPADLPPPLTEEFLLKVAGQKIARIEAALLEVVDDVATKPVPDPEGELLGEIQNLEVRTKMEPIEIHDYGTTSLIANTWGNWNNTVTFDTTSSTTTQSVYKIWINGFTDNVTTDIGWEDTTGGQYRAKRTEGIGATWKMWNTATAGTDVIVRATWDGWNMDWQPTPARVTAIGAPFVHTRGRETDAERTAREEREIKARLEREERAKDRKAIDGRAEQLLLSLMNEQQRKDWVASGEFYLIKDERRYRIKRGSHGNVELVDEKNQILERFCALPQGELPMADTVAGQLLALRFDEEEFINKANASMQKVGHKPLKQRIREHGHLRLAA